MRNWKSITREFCLPMARVSCCRLGRSLIPSSLTGLASAIYSGSRTAGSLEQPAESCLSDRDVNKKSRVQVFCIFAILSLLADAVILVDPVQSMRMGDTGDEASCVRRGYSNRAMCSGSGPDVDESGDAKRSSPQVFAGRVRRLVDR